MAIRKAKAYSKKICTAYTRKSRIKSKNYVKTVPPQKIVKFNMEKTSDYLKGNLKNVIRLIAEHEVQIRDLALEATRQRLHNVLQKKLLGNYYLACKPFPHQILRDNKIFSGGSKGERIQSGMKHSFGSTTGRAAHVKAGDTVFLIAFPNKKDTAFVRALCKSCVPKLPCKTRILYEETK